MKVVKLKGTHLFDDPDWKTIQNAIEIMNMVVVRATLLGKLYYLTIARGPGHAPVTSYSCLAVMSRVGLRADVYL
jgi:hypothetical protein